MCCKSKLDQKVIFHRVLCAFGVEIWASVVGKSKAEENNKTRSTAETVKNSQ